MPVVRIVQGWAPPGFTRQRETRACRAGYCRAGCQVEVLSGAGLKLRSAIVCSTQDGQVSITRAARAPVLAAGAFRNGNSSTRPLGDLCEFPFLTAEIQGHLQAFLQGPRSKGGWPEPCRPARGRRCRPRLACR